MSKRFGPPTTSASASQNADAPRTLFDVGVRIEKDGKISLNRDRLDAALERDPAGTKAFFQQSETGFADAADALVTGLTDPFSGLLKLESTSLERRQAEITDRVGDLESQLLLKRDRLVRQFAAMEETVSRINSFQSALSNIRPLELVSSNR